MVVYYWWFCLKSPLLIRWFLLLFSATVQSYFQLQKPISELIPYISRLEYDVNEEIGVLSLKVWPQSSTYSSCFFNHQIQRENCLIITYFLSQVAVLSIHQADLSNSTDVVFGFLPDPINTTTNPVALSVLKSSLIDLFLQQYNLTLTPTIFGESSSFEILKFPGGVTIIPENNPLLSLPLVNFTLNSSIYDIKGNLPELKKQLKLGLHLMPNEVKLNSTLNTIIIVCQQFKLSKLISLAQILELVT